MEHDDRVIGIIESVTIKENGVRVNLVVHPDGRALQVLSILCGQPVILEAQQKDVEMFSGDLEE